MRRPKNALKRLWVNGTAAEDRDEWEEEALRHCEKAYDDKEETNEKQRQRIEVHREKGWRGKPSRVRDLRSRLLCRTK